jgi:hypothetical protein
VSAAGDHQDRQADQQHHHDPGDEEDALHDGG